MTKPITNSRRQLLLNLRRSVVAHRRFDVKLSEDGEDELQTCRTCGHVVKTSAVKIYGGATGTLRKKLAAYRSNGFVSGKCPHCTKQMRNERYPLNGKGD